MNIRHLQSSFFKISQDNVIKFLYDLLFQDLRNITNYQEGYVYNKGDRVYLQENGKHQIFQCLVESSSSTFINEEWAYILEIYEGNVDKVYNVQIKEEVHFIEEYNRSVIYTNLEFEKTQSTVAVYCGKNRYTINHDFKINGNEIIFNEPFNIGDRLILEVRETIGVLPEMVCIVLYDLNKKPYKVGIDYNGNISIEDYMHTDVNDVRYSELVTGDRTYTLLVDGGSRPYELKAYRKIETYITGTNNEIYKVELIDDNLNLIDYSNDRTAYSDTKYILGLDKKFYTLSQVNGKIIATEALDTGLEIRNVDLGVRLINDKFESRIICIDNGNISILPYIDNGGYHYINFIDRTTKNVVRLSISEGDTIELNDDLAEDGLSGTRLLDYFYFFDDEWNYKRMFVKDGRLYFEDTVLNVIPDSRGINLRKFDGEMMKLRIPHTGHGIHLVKCISLDNMGTFESPIEGFVMKIKNTTKLVTVNKQGDGFTVVNTKLPFRTNHHYILSKDNKLYKIAYDRDEIHFVEESNINVLEPDHDDYQIECLYEGAYIKSYETITRFDIINGECVFHPISTFKHVIKSDDGNSYVMDVTGEKYNEILTFTNVNNVNFNVEVGAGNLYLEAVDGTRYIVNIDENGNMNFKEGETGSYIDYNITSLVNSSQGLYRLIIEDENIKLEKMFDNMFESDLLSYGNLVKKSFNVQLGNNLWYSFASNGLGEVVLQEIDKVDASGLLLRSDDGYNYGLGILGNQFITYRSYITNPLVQEKLYITDTITGNKHVLFMNGSRLCSETTTDGTGASYLLMHDAYNNKFKIEIADSKLIVSSL